jgi:hypothetical protein
MSAGRSTRASPESKTSFATRRGLNLGLQNVRLRRKQHAELQLTRAHLVGNGVRRFDEHFIRYALGVCGVNGHPDGSDGFRSNSTPCRFVVMFFLASFLL